MTWFVRLLRCVPGLGALLFLPAVQAQERIPVKVMIVSCFEVGNDTGDALRKMRHPTRIRHLHVFR